MVLRKLLGAFGRGDALTGISGLVGIARPPRSAEEQRVARVLAGLSVCTRAALVDALADDLRLAEDDPFRAAAELGAWRLALYHRAADELVSALVGDFLIESSQESEVRIQGESPRP